jgi:hypothetical protein
MLRTPAVIIGGRFANLPAGDVLQAPAFSAVAQVPTLAGPLGATLITTALVGVMLYSPIAFNTVVDAFDMGVVPPTGAMVTLLNPPASGHSIDLFAGGAQSGTQYPLGATCSTMIGGQSVTFRFDGALWQPMMGTSSPTFVVGNGQTVGTLAVGPAGSNSSSIECGGTVGSIIGGIVVSEIQLQIAHLSSTADIRSTVAAGPGSLDISAQEPNPSNTLVTGQAGTGVITNIITSTTPPPVAAYKYEIAVLGGSGTVQINNLAGGVGQVKIPGAASHLSMTQGQWCRLDYDLLNELGFGANTWVVMATTGTVI